MSHEDAELDGLVAGLRAKTQEMAATSDAGRYNRLFKQREEIYAAIEALPAGAEALRQLFDDPDPKIRLDVAQHCMYKSISPEAALHTLHRLALRSDKIGDGAKSSLQVRLPKLRSSEPHPSPGGPLFQPPSLKGNEPGAPTTGRPPCRRLRPACRWAIQRGLPAHHLSQAVR